MEFTHCGGASFYSDVDIYALRQREDGSDIGIDFGIVVIVLPGYVIVAISIRKVCLPIYPLGELALGYGCDFVLVGILPQLFGSGIVRKLDICVKVIGVAVVIEIDEPL